MLVQIGYRHLDGPQMGSLQDFFCDVVGECSQESYHSTERMGFDELIDPRETRDALLAPFRAGSCTSTLLGAPVIPVSRY